jgi:hypothetical protein
MPHNLFSAERNEYARLDLFEYANARIVAGFAHILSIVALVFDRFHVDSGA